MRIFFVILTLACLVPSASAQVSCQSGLLVDTLPAAPLPGEPIIVRMRNLGFNSFQIPSNCIFSSVHPTACGQPAVFTPTACVPTPVNITPGTTFLGQWDQKNDLGQLVAPGTYFFRVPIVGFPDCCVPVTIAPCPVPTPYGVEGPGTGNFVPTLSAAGPAQVGQPLQLDIQNGVGGAPAILFVTFAQAVTRAPFGDLYVDLTPPFLQAVLPLSGAAGAPGQGSISLNASIPNDASLATLRLYLQALVYDTGATGFLSHTAGLEVYVCP